MQDPKKDVDPPSKPEPARLDGVHVVVVDDSTDEREMLTFIFEKLGATVTTAPSADEALSAIRAVRADVLVSDIGLADRDGYSLVRELRTWPSADGGETPAVALTGWCGEGYRTAAIDAGFQAHLAKPVPVDTLVAVVAALAHRRDADSRAAADARCVSSTAHSR